MYELFHVSFIKLSYSIGVGARDESVRIGQLETRAYALRVCVCHVKRMYHTHTHTHTHHLQN